MAEAKKASDGDFVWVICGLAHGIKLEIQHAKPDPMSKEPPRDNPFQGQVYEIPGTNAVARSNDREIANPGKTDFGVGAKVPADFWAEWRKWHEDTPFIKNGLVAAFPLEAEAKSEAKARRGEKSGIQPLDPKKDLPKGVEKADGDK